MAEIVRQADRQTEGHKQRGNNERSSQKDSLALLGQVVTLLHVPHRIFVQKQNIILSSDSLFNFILITCQRKQFSPRSLTPTSKRVYESFITKETNRQLDSRTVRHQSI